MKNIFIFYLLAFTILNAATLDSKKTYTSGEVITIKVTDLKITPKNWLGIYSKNDNNSWKNVLRWTWTKGKKTGNFDFKGLPEGKYQARVFYNNSYKTEASVNFEVDSDKKTTVGTNKKSYYEGEIILAATDGMSGHPKDWIAIYPKGSSNSWKNVIQWHFLGGRISPDVEFKDLQAGSYEVRVFFRNSYKLEAKASFEVKKSTATSIRHTIDKVVSHCNSEHEAIDSIICLDAEKDFAYALHHKKDKGDEYEIIKIYDFVRINLKKKTSKAIKTNIELSNLHEERREWLSLKEFKDTPVYLYKKTSSGRRHLIQQWDFKYQDKTILSFEHQEKFGGIYDIHTTNNGKNLVISYRNVFNEPEGDITDTYDISTPSVAELIDRQIKP